MSKPLTIEELKALPNGDWVWHVCLYSPLFTTYIQKTLNDETYFQTDKDGGISYSDYGLNWIAYKNKEQAKKQTKYNVGDMVWYLQMKGYGCTSEEAMEIVVNSDIVKRIYAGKTKTTYYLKNISCGIDEKYLYKSKKEAQQRLKELQGK